MIIMLEKFLKMSILFDFYGALLTEKQQRCLQMHFSDDLSLSEIADQLGVSRQAVYDIIHRSEQLLNEYEVKLQLVQRYHEERRQLEVIYSELQTAAENASDDLKLQHILQKMAKLLGNVKEA